jgi:hypothetical protein
MTSKYTSVFCVWYCGCCMQDNQTDLLGDLGSHWCDTFYYFRVINTSRNTIESSVLGSHKHILSLTAMKLSVNIFVFVNYSYWSMQCWSWSIHEHRKNNCNKEAEELLLSLILITFLVQLLCQSHKTHVLTFLVHKHEISYLLLMKE